MSKRLFDVCFAGAVLLIAVPLLPLVALAIRLDSRGPIFYRQQRLGLHGSLFWMYKLRTMVVGADRAGPSITAGGDPRVTRLGRRLRKWKIDELPQFFNVLRGEMSVVGPRPETPDHLALFTPERWKVLEVRPGITDPASIAFRDEEQLLASQQDKQAFYAEELFPAKAALNLEYLERRSVGHDVRLILRTLGATLKGRG